MKNIGFVLCLVFSLLALVEPGASAPLGLSFLGVGLLLQRRARKF